MTPSMAYSTFVVCLLWLDLVRLLSMFKSGFSSSLELFIKILWLFWAIWICVNATNIYRSFLREDGVVNFFERWAKAVPLQSDLAIRLKK